MKYSEDLILDEVQGYIESTYGEHYAGESEIQLFDYWQSLGILTEVSIGTAIKYLARFGKKEGSNKKDLLKAIHYTMLAMYNEFYTEDGDGFADDSDDDKGSPEPYVPEGLNLMPIGTMEDLVNYLNKAGANNTK